MGLEYSEGFTAALSVMSDDDLAMADSSAEGGVYNGVKYDKKFQEIYQKTIEIFDGSQIKDGQGNKTKTGMDKKMNQFEFEDGEIIKEPEEQMYKDYAAAISAIRGVRSRTRFTGPAGEAYLTGNKWNSAVSGFKIKFKKMKDYNSSDVIIKSLGEFVGISLKKKSTVNAASPPLINNAFSNFVDGNDKNITKARESLHVEKVKFFASVIQEACGTVTKEGESVSGPLAGHVLCPEIVKLNPNNYQQALKIWNMKVERIKFEKDKETGKMVPVRDAKGNIETEKISLINLKGLDHLVRRSGNVINNKFDGKVQSDFRAFVNKKLQSKDGGLSSLYAAMHRVMSQDEIKDTLADELLDRSLKLSLHDELFTKYGKFDFYLVTGIGTVGKKDGKVNQIKVSQAGVIPLTSLITANYLLKGLGSWLKIQDSTYKNDAASVDFILYKGPENNIPQSTALLHITLRYGGSFTASPRFHATIHDDFKKVIKYGEKGLKGTAGYFR